MPVQLFLTWCCWHVSIHESVSYPPPQSGHCIPNLTLICLCAAVLVFLLQSHSTVLTGWFHKVRHCIFTPVSAFMGGCKLTSGSDCIVSSRTQPQQALAAPRHGLMQGDGSDDNAGRWLHHSSFHTILHHLLVVYLIIFPVKVGSVPVFMLIQASRTLVARNCTRGAEWFTGEYVS